MWIIFLIILSVWLAALVITGVGGLIHALMTLRQKPTSAPMD